MLFWYSKSYFDIRTESENAILIFKILFWHSNWVGKYFDYFDIRTSENPHIFTFELFDIRTESENSILTFKIHSNWVGKSYFDIRNPILTFELSPKIVFWYSKSYLSFELSRKIVFWHSKSDLTFALSRKMLFWY